MSPPTVPPRGETPQWAIKLARALTIHFGSETTGAQRDETYQNIARALVAIARTPPGEEPDVSPALRDQPRERVEAALDLAVKALGKIAGQAGIPDPIEACRAILATVDRARAEIAELRR